MLISTRVLEGTEIAAYGRLIESCRAALLYHTPDYLRFLRSLLPEGEQILLVAETGRGLVGALPLFAASGPYGPIVNSLPYFGSHGDILVADEFAEKSAVAHALTNALAVLLKNAGFAAVNVIAHPNASLIEDQASSIGLEPWDRRISQITELGAARDPQSALAQILSTCQQKTRNLVRKGLKSGFSIDLETADGAWADMIEHHQQGMRRIGGRAKSQREFDCLRSAFGPNQCRLYVARKNGAFAGALLNLYFRDRVEYFTPVAVEDYRGEQVLSALIAQAMSDAILEKRRYWNWGGTWASQAGVYHFKRGWGAIDRDYTYWGKVFDSGAKLSDVSPVHLAEQYKFFYVRPFSRSEG
jgi:hypothetical protein